MSRTMQVASTLQELREQLARLRERSATLALVPTMGALHAGHLSLIGLAHAQADAVIASIFVNPLQFGAGEDFERYPRRRQEDLQKLHDAGVALAWLPTVEEMYPQGFATTVRVQGPATAGLEDAHRPGHFDGVATVVAKLFIQTGCDVAIFGEKDYQQLQVIRRMVQDLSLPVRIIAAPTVREEDGLALSSRNAYLTEEERRMAPRLHAELKRAAQRLRAGTSPLAVEHDATQALHEAGFVVDYVAVRHAETLQPPQDWHNAPLRVLAAARLGETRLIDNVAV